MFLPLFLSLIYGEEKNHYLSTYKDIQVQNGGYINGFKKHKNTSHLHSNFKVKDARK